MDHADDRRPKVNYVANEADRCADGALKRLCNEIEEAKSSCRFGSPSRRVQPARSSERGRFASVVMLDLDCEVGKRTEVGEPVAVEGRTMLFRRRDRHNRAQVSGA